MNISFVAWPLMKYAFFASLDKINHFSGLLWKINSDMKICFIHVPYSLTTVLLKFIHAVRQCLDKGSFLSKFGQIE